MASDKTLKFYKAAAAPSTAAIGSVWFDTANRLINVKVAASGDKQWESYSGLQNASWIEASQTLRLVKANGENLDVNLSDVASASELTKVGNRVLAIETWQGTTITDLATINTNITNLQTEAGKNTLKLADITEGQTVKAVIDAAVKVEADRAKGVEGGHETRIGALEATKGDHEGRIAELEGYFDGEGEGVSAIVAAAIEKNNTDVVTPGLASKADKATYEAYVSANDAAVAAVKKTAEDEVTRATGVEAAIQADLDVVEATVAALVGADVPAEGVAQKSVREISAEEVAKIVANADADYNTLKEIADWILAHPTDAAEYNSRISANETAIGKNTAAINLLNNNAQTEGSVAYAVAQAKAAIEGTFVAGETSKTLAAINADVAALEGLVGTTSVSSQITAITDPLALRVGANETAIGAVPGAIATAKGEAISAIKGDVETLDTLGKVEDKIAAMEQIITDNNDAAVKSVVGTTPKYITVSGEKEVSISIAPGAMGDDALVTGATAKTYVDTQLANSWLWEEFA